MAKIPLVQVKDVMRALDKKDRNFYVNLSVEQKKAFSTWMMMRYASSSQAKGRVERANKTLQDRLIKEMRLDGISNIEDANIWLPKL